MDPDGGRNRVSEIPSTEIWFELRKILSSKPFQRCPKLRKFLGFIVEETMDGRGNRLTEYVLGIEIFGRHASYDPRLDSRVRVEAYRLRVALAAFYEKEGRSDAVIIRLGKGSYSPYFLYRNCQPNGFMDSTKEGVL
jgi:adenylate cyclase